MWWGYKAAGKMIGGSARTGARTGSAMGDTLNHRMTMRSASKGARRGYLAPGDPTPPPTAPTDYFDYRGVATWNEASNLDDGQFPLGAFLDLKKGKACGPIGVPGQALNRHAVVVGPSGSGKTFSLLVPWIYAALESGWSVVAVDVKGDLRENVMDFVDAQGSSGLGAGLVKWDFTDPRRSLPWDWISELHDEARVDAAVTAILGKPQQSGGADPFFFQRDYRTLRGMLMFARAALPKVRTAADLLRALEDDVALDASVRANPRAPGAGDLSGGVLSYPQADYAKAVSGVVTHLSALDTTGVNAVTRTSSARPSLNLERALEEHQLLVIGAPLRAGEVSVTMSGLILNQLTQRLYERFSSDGRPVLLVIDEAPVVAQRVEITRMMDVARSAGVGVVTAMQDVTQIKDENERSSILSNAATFAILPGASPASAKAFGERLGQRHEQTFGLNYGGGPSSFGGRIPGQSYGTESVPVMREREIMQPPFSPRCAVVHLKVSELGITNKPLLIDMER